MTRLLAAAAVLVSLAAIVASAQTIDPAPRTAPIRADTQPRPAAPTSGAPARARPGDASEQQVGRVATSYALAARNWSASTRVESWRRQRALATGRHHDELDQVRPTPAVLQDLRAERASSVAITAAAPDVRRTGGRARVDVALHERTRAGSQAVADSTRNRVTLRRSGGAWRVTGWTILPGAGR